MPARSRSQQRLFGMVHAYNKGEFHGSRSLRDKLERISDRISDEDARHFASTKHDDLPEKRAQLSFSPEDVQRMYGGVQQIPFPVDVHRSRERRSLLGSALRGTLYGTAFGALGMGALGAFLAHRAGSGVEGISQSELHGRMVDAAARMGLWGAKGGAAIGGIAGVGLNIMDKIRG